MLDAGMRFCLTCGDDCKKSLIRLGLRHCLQLTFSLNFSARKILYLVYLAVLNSSPYGRLFSGPRQAMTQALATLFEIKFDFPDDFDHGSRGPRCGEAAEGPCRDNLDRRMTCFLESLYDACPNSIPAGIVFVPGRRLSVEGFGWDPCTWMVGQNVGHDDPIFTHTTAAELTVNGLLVRYPGFLLRSSENRIYDPVEQKVAFPCDILLLEWYCV